MHMERQNEFYSLKGIIILWFLLLLEIVMTLLVNVTHDNDDLIM